MLNILALFRHRRAPRRTRKPNGSSQSMDLTALGGPISSARGTVAKASPTKPRPRQDAAASRQQGAQGYLAAHNLQKSYGGRRVVNGVSLYVRRGEAVGLLGPNGAGKTTAFYMITGLIKAESGQIELDGHDVTHLPMYQRARLGIGYLPQEASIFRPSPPRRRSQRAAGRVRDHAASQDAVHRAVGWRTSPGRDRPGAGEPPQLHAARRTVRRHRSQGSG